MRGISKSTLHKTVIGLSATACIVMGQNCGRQMEFAANGGNLPSMKDGGGIVTTLQPTGPEATESAQRIADGGSTTPAPVDTASVELPAGGKQEGPVETSERSSQDVAGDEEMPSAPEDQCMDVARVGDEDLKHIATLDHHGKVQTIVLCHNDEHHPMNKVVNGHSLKAHLGQGDYLGTCGQPAVKTCHEKVASVKHDHHDDKGEHRNCHDHKGESGTL